MVFREYVRVFFLILSFSIGELHSQDLLPPITNFSPNLYGAAAQNWDIDISNEGYIYVANNQGLLEYNGLNWKTYELPDNKIIRSVHVKDSLIYTGAYNEFGYWKKDTTGELIYQSLTAKTEGFSLHEEIWQITSNDDLIYLRSFGKIYVYDGDRITVAESVNSNSIISFQGKLWVTDRERGLCELTNQGLQVVNNQKLLTEDRVVDVTNDKERIILATKSKLFHLKDSLVEPLGTESLWEKLKKWEINKIELIDTSSLAIGTVKNGLIMYDFTNETIQIINRPNGLQNNTILSLKNTGEALWVGLDYGIDRVDLRSPITFFTENSGELGTVYDVTSLNDKIFVGSNTGVYTFDENNLKILQGTEGHTWNLLAFKSRLYINHNSGTYLFENDEVKSLESRTGSFKIRSIDNDSEFLIGTYTGLRHYNDTIKNIPSLNFPVKDFLIEDNSNVWLLGLYDGLLKVTHDSTYTEIESAEIDIPNGSTESNTRIMNIENQFAVFNRGEWFKYNPFENNLEEFKDFEFLKNKKPIFADRDFFWFLDLENKSFFITNFKDLHVDLHSKQLKNRLFKNYENVIRKNDSTFIITLKDGFAEIDVTKLDRSIFDEMYQKPKVVGIRNHDMRFDLKNNTLPFKKSRDLFIDVAYPSSDRIDVKYKLVSPEAVNIGVLSSGSIYFQNLYEDEYRLDFFVEDTKLGVLDLGSYQFTISPPWYNSVLMRFVYVLLCLSVIYLVYQIHKFRLKKHQRALVENYERIKQEETKKQEKQKLIDELNSKSKELANTTLTLAKKNEFLLELEREIKENQDSFTNRYKLKNLLGKINTALNNKNEWEVFETNFNEIHDDFFKSLLRSYPELTNSDLKLCAYLKMNMTSKEIAPLMRISIRGVEVHRYRLRKKLHLNNNQSLNKFLIKNF